MINKVEFVNNVKIIKIVRLTNSVKKEPLMNAKKFQLLDYTKNVIIQDKFVNKTYSVKVLCV